jgi:hypothetical protein
MKRFLALLVVLAGLVVAAALAIPSNAMTVNGAAIGQQTLVSDLSAIAGSASYQCYLGAELTLQGQSTAGLFPVTGSGSTTSTPRSYNTTFVRYWLAQLATDELVTQQVAARNLVVSPADLALARTTLTQQTAAVLDEYERATGGNCGTTANGVLASVPSTFRDGLVQAQAQRDLLLVHEAGYGLTPASLRRYYSGHRASFDTICVSYVSFDSESAAAAAQASIAAGTPIAQTGTEVPLGCAVSASITSLPPSVTSLALGKVSAPLAEGTSTGRYALLTVTKRTATAFPSARAAVEAALLGAGSRRTDAVLAVANRRATVTADPRYGKVRPHTVALGAPASPPPATLVNPTANLPSTPPSTPSTSPGGHSSSSAPSSSASG